MFFLHDKVKAAASKYNIKVFDLFDAYSKYKVGDIKLEENDICHPNLLGHAIAGKAIYQHIRESVK